MTKHIKKEVVKDTEKEIQNKVIMKYNKMLKDKRKELRYLNYPDDIIENEIDKMRHNFSIEAMELGMFDVALEFSSSEEDIAYLLEHVNYDLIAPDDLEALLYQVAYSHRKKEIMNMLNKRNIIKSRRKEILKVIEEFSSENKEEKLSVNVINASNELQERVHNLLNRNWTHEEEEYMINEYTRDIIIEALENNHFDVVFHFLNEISDIDSWSIILNNINFIKISSKEFSNILNQLLEVDDKHIFGILDYDKLLKSRRKDLIELYDNFSKGNKTSYEDVEHSRLFGKRKSRKRKSRKRKSRKRKSF